MQAGHIFHRHGDVPEPAGDLADVYTQQAQTHEHRFTTYPSQPVKIRVITTLGANGSQQHGDKGFTGG